MEKTCTATLFTKLIDAGLKCVIHFVYRPSLAAFFILNCPGSVDASRGPQS